MSDYQSRGQGGWPAQPPVNNGYGHGQPGHGYGQAPEGTYDQPLAAAPPRRRRRRGPVILLAVVILILAVLGIGDQVARSYAQNRIAQQIQASANLSAKPSVSIEGWPFLTQVAAHDVKAVDISASDVTADSGKLPFSFTAKASGVHLNSSFNSATIDQINGHAILPFSSVVSLLGLPGGTVTLGADPAGGPNAVKADAGIGSVTGTVRLAGPNQIDVQLNSATGLASLLGGLAGNVIRIQIPPLPAGLVVRSVSVNSQGIVAVASASNTTLSQLSSGGRPRGGAKILPLQRRVSPEATPSPGNYGILGHTGLKGRIGSALGSAAGWPIMSESAPCTNFSGVARDIRQEGQPKGTAGGRGREYVGANPHSWDRPYRDDYPA